MAAIGGASAATRDPARFLLRRALPAVIVITVVTAFLRWLAVDQGLIGEALGVTLMTVFCIVVFSGLSFWSAHRLRAAMAVERRTARDTLYRTVARNYPNGSVLVFDPDLRYQLVEGSTLTTVGLTPGDLEGRTIWEALDAETVARIEPAYRAALAGETRSFELDYRGHTYLVAIAPTYDDRGTITGGLVQTLQITDQKRLEEQLSQSQKLEAVGQLAGGVAHDFNNLLTVISGYADLALKDTPAGEPANDALQEIQIASERAAVLVRQLLAFSRKQVLKPQLLRVGEVVEGVVPMLRRLIEANVELSVRIAPGSPQVLFDRGQLEQVLVNLVVNARDAMPDGGRISIETGETFLDETYARTHADAQTGPHVVLSISDTGEGMDEATRARIFEPFFTTKPAGVGTGLGLSTVHGIVKQSGGNIWVYSEAGRGTTFKIYVPLATDAELAVVPAEETPSPASVPSTTGTALVVEDDDGVKSLIRVVLTEAGWNVLEASSPDEARSVLGEHAVDVVLSDIVIAGGSGRDLVGIDDVEGRRPAIVFMSGYTEQALTAQSLLESGSRFLEKPFTPSALVAAVAEAAAAPVPS